ncbi:tetratricopeptide repeat protein [Taklimakanibacter lacteus]|uniref:tetratricopeptide repeat protein n=1 Tax=Taklimakanibacter lacteus TaxID=2268456 RepID=UPI0013C463BF
MARQAGLAALLVAASLALGACQNKSAELDGADPMATGSTSKPSLKETAKLAKKWQADPKNLHYGLAYADHLKSLGQGAQQLQVLAQLTQYHPQDQALMTRYGRELAQAGQTDQAADILSKAIAQGSTDWKVYSAMGSVLDQQAKYAQARDYYQRALKIAPGNAAVLNNLGMSYALEGDLKQAEATLREASNLPAGRGEPRLRQNLALVVGLQGRFDEARQIASADLPPDEVEANMAYLQKMLAQPNTWQQLTDKPAG